MKRVIATSFSLLLVVMLATGASFFPGDDFEEVSYEPASDIAQCIDIADLRFSKSGMLFYQGDVSQPAVPIYHPNQLCTSGGEGATSCSITIGFKIGDFSCSNSCGDGYYACCGPGGCSCETY